MNRTAACLVLLLLPCAACSDATVPSVPIAVDGPGYRGVLLPPRDWPAYAFEIEGHWDATVADVRRAEAALPAAAKRLLPDLDLPLERYVRQYV